MAILYANHLGGTTTDNPLTLAATTFNSAGLADLPTVASPNIVRIVLDPEAVDGAPEIVYVTAHTSAATSATVARGQEGSSAREHPVGTAWVVAATAADFSGGLLGKSGLAKGDLLVATGSTATARQAVGSDNQVLVADSAQTNGVKWATVAAANIASNAVTTAKILDENVTSAKIADLNVTTDKIADGAVTIDKLDVSTVTVDQLDGPAPTWTSPVSSGLNVGNGSFTNVNWTRAGRLVIASFDFVLGSTSSITGAVGLNLPIDTIGTRTVGGSAWLLDASTGTRHLGFVEGVSASTAAVRRWRVVGSDVTQQDLASTVPFTWTTNDRIEVTLVYIAAP